jgi:hypothetical protein
MRPAQPLRVAAHRRLATKAWNLMLMARAGLPVTAAFVLRRLIQGYAAASQCETAAAMRR